MQVPAFQCGGKRDRAGRNPVQAAGFRKQMGPEPLPPDGFGAMSGLVQSVPRMAGYLCQSRYRAWRIESPLLAFEAKKNSPHHLSLQHFQLILQLSLRFSPAGGGRETCFILQTKMEML